MRDFKKHPFTNQEKRDILGLTKEECIEQAKVHAMLGNREKSLTYLSMVSH